MSRRDGRLSSGISHSARGIRGDSGLRREPRGAAPRCAKPLLCLADEGGYEYATSPDCLIPLLPVAGALLGRVARTDYRRRYQRMFQQLEIPVNVKDAIKYPYLTGLGEELRVAHHHQSAPWIILDIVVEATGHFIVEGDPVVEFRGKHLQRGTSGDLFADVVDA